MTEIDAGADEIRVMLVLEIPLPTELIAVTVICVDTPGIRDDNVVVVTNPTVELDVVPDWI